MFLCTVSLQNLVNQLPLFGKIFVVNFYRRSVIALFGSSLYTSQNIGIFLVAAYQNRVVFLLLLLILAFFFLNRFQNIPLFVHGFVFNRISFLV